MMSPAHQFNTNRLLGYPDDARLLLINADDFGMYRGINEATVRAFKEGIVRSTSLMMPCPGALQAVQLLQDNSEIRFGVHLSVVRDIAHYDWDPLTPKEKIPSLLDDSGTLYGIARMSEMLERAKLDELEVEFRAQIESALAARLAPTHLDWHCLLDGGRPDIFDLTMGLAREYGLALRVMSPKFVDQVQSQGLPTVDHSVLDSFGVPLDDKSARYAQLLRGLPAGLSEWAVHPGLDDADSKAIDPNGWPVRHADYDFLMSPQARDILDEEGISLLSYEPLQKVWRDRSS
jgi:predicted glycoside hydrolase/deacetylase ChbG (UPF0249 family)